MGCTPTKQTSNTEPSTPPRPVASTPITTHDKSGRRTIFQKQESLRQKIASNFSARWALGKMSEVVGIRERYKLLDIVGHGRYGVVYKAESKSVPPRSVAIKIVRINDEEERNLITQEIKLLKSLDHPNIVKYYEQFEEGPYVFVVTEYCSGGELLDRISVQETFKEVDAARIIEKLLRALNHCHCNKIIHRDIKPENIMYSSPDPGAEVKFIDFGLADEIHEVSRKNSDAVFGTLNYISPETLQGIQNESGDVWSLGVVLHFMLSGVMPFRGKKVREIIQKIAEARLDFSSSEWKNVSEEGKDLVEKMLNPDVEKRLTVKSALNHSWFSKVEKITEANLEQGKDLIKKIRDYKVHSKFQQCVLNIFVKTLTDKEIKQLTETFNLMDKEKTGYISSQDLIEHCKKRYSDSDNIRFVSEFSSHHPQEINYTQFIAATLDTKSFLTNERLHSLFQYFDITNNGFITVADLEIVLSHTSEKEFTKEEVKKMLLEHGIEKEEQLTFEEFKSILNKMNLNPEEEMLDIVYEL